MKIISWNCNGAFRKKYFALEDFDADLLIVQECEDPARSTSAYNAWAGDYLWLGRNKNKGIGVFPRNGTNVERLDWPDGNLQSFLPCRVNNRFNLLSVWTMQANSPTFQYVGQLWKYIQLNKDLIANGSTVICGDFNSNVLWDKWDRWWNHSDVVRELAEHDIHSLYHEFSKEKQGEETSPTLYLHRKTSRPYHIDYAFVSKCLMDGASIEIGSPEEWLDISDHMPLLFEIRIPNIS